MAVVFITRVDGEESKQEGICIKCAKELGIKPVDDIISFSHPYGCSQMGEDQENFRKIFADLTHHPNAGGVLVLGTMNEVHFSRKFPWSRSIAAAALCAIFCGGGLWLGLLMLGDQAPQ